MAAKTALVLGGTGLVGTALLKHLNTTPRYQQIKILTRRPISNLKDYPKFSSIDLPDFDQMQAVVDQLQADDVYCALGTTIKKAGSQSAFYTVDFTYPYALAQLALQQGARHFLIVTAHGANPGSKIFYNRVKGEVEQALQRLPYPNLTIFRPSLLLGDRTEYRFGESLAQTFSHLFGWVFPASLKPVTAETVAQAMITLADRTGAPVRIVESDEIRQLVTR